VVGYGPDGITGHTDHKTGSRVVTEAFKQSKAQKLYYISLPRSASGIFAIGGAKRPLAPTVKVDIRPYKKLKMLAIDEHATQKWFAGYMQHVTMLNWFDNEYFTLGAENK